VNFKSFFAELKRRNVYKVGVAIPTMHPFAKQIVASLALKEWSRHSRRGI